MEIEEENGNMRDPTQFGIARGTIFGLYDPKLKRDIYVQHKLGGYSEAMRRAGDTYFLAVGDESEGWVLVLPLQLRYFPTGVNSGNFRFPEAPINFSTGHRPDFDLEPVDKVTLPDGKVDLSTLVLENSRIFDYVKPTRA